MTLSDTTSTGVEVRVDHTGKILLVSSAGLSSLSLNDLEFEEIKHKVALLKETLNQHKRTYDSLSQV